MPAHSHVCVRAVLLTNMTSVQVANSNAAMMAKFIRQWPVVNGVATAPTTAAVQALKTAGPTEFL